LAKESRSLASRAAKGQGTGCLALFFGAFLLAGLGFAVPILFWPLWRFAQARGWQAVPCTIESATVETHPSDEGDPTYSVEVSYLYEVTGRSYRGDRYHFFTGSTSGYDGKAAVVAALPPGTRTECWVNPEDPEDSVLRRRLGWELMFGLLPLTFVAVGGGGVAWALSQGVKQRRRRRATAMPFGEPGGVSVRELSDPVSSAAHPEWLPAGPGTAIGTRGSVQLEPAHGPVTRLVGSVLVALFWNGIVGVFLWKVVEGWRAGSPDGCLTLFLVPFLLVGLALLVNVPYQVLAFFNPRPRLTLSAATVPVGGAVRVHWQFSGAAGRLRTLRLWVEGREEAVYRRGTSTHTDTHTFARLPVVELAAPAPLGTGEGTVSIPAGTMHSFGASRNRVVWKLKLHGEIARWPDVAEEFDLVVEPRWVG
jgi:hypothetical protein